jgi:hypothetical protein
MAASTDGGARAIDAVKTRETAQLVVAEGLNADAQPVDAGAPERRQPSLGDRLRVGFHRDFAVRRHVERVFARLDDPRDLPGLEQRRRPAAEIDRVGRALTRSRDLGEQRLDIARLEIGVEQPAVEVTVIANRGAERDVDVKA